MEATTPPTPLDHYGRPVQVGDVLISCGWASGGDFPLWLTSLRLRVVKVNRKRVVVTSGGFVGTQTIATYTTMIIERDGEPFATDHDAWFAARSAEIMGA